MHQTKNTKHSAVVALALVMLGSLVGCSIGSDRTINLPDRDLKMGTPMQVQPPGATIAAFSQDGRNYAVTTPAGFEVRSYEGKTLFSDTKSANQPLMFTNSGARLVCMAVEQIDADHATIQYSSLDWSSGKSQDLPIKLTEADKSVGMILLFHPAGYDKNPEQSILYAGTHVVLATGAVVPLPKGSEFDGWGQDGVLILRSEKDKNSCVGVWPDGTVRGRQRPPDADFRKNPIHRQNQELAIDEIDMLHGESRANLGGLWLTHAQAFEGDGRRASALVGAGYDFKGFGFVPGHDAVWYNADDGSFVVPYTMEPGQK